MSMSQDVHNIVTSTCNKTDDIKPDLERHSPTTVSSDKTDLLPAGDGDSIAVKHEDDEVDMPNLLPVSSEPDYRQSNCGACEPNTNDASTPNNHRSSLNELIRNMVTPTTERSRIPNPGTFRTPVGSITPAATSTPTYFTNGWSSLLSKAGADSDRPSIFASLSSTLSSWNEMKNKSGSETTTTTTVPNSYETDNRLSTFVVDNLMPNLEWKSPTPNEPTPADRVVSTPVSATTANCAKKKVIKLFNLARHIIGS